MAGWTWRRRLGWGALAGFAGAMWFVLGGQADAPEPFDAPLTAVADRADLPVVGGSPAIADAVPTATGDADAAILKIPANDKGRDFVREVQEALAPGTPAGALAAAELIGRCLEADRRVADLFEGQNQQAFQDVLMKKVFGLFGFDEKTLIEHAQREQRNCQGLDAQTRAMRPALLQKALDARTEGAALRYLEWAVETQGAKADPAQLQDLRSTIRSEADAGSINAIYALASEKLPMTLSPDARHAYARATDLIEDSWAQDETMGQIAKPLLAMRQLFGSREVDPSLTREQLQVAEAQARRLFEAYKRREAARHRGVG